VGDVLEISGSARRQMRKDYERLMAYGARLREVRHLYWLHWWGK